MKRAVPFFRALLSAGGLLLCLAAPVFAAPDDDFTAPFEPDAYRMEDYLAPTPLTLKGVRVVSNEEAYALWQEGKTVFVDVMPRPVKPANLPANVIWRDKPHDGLPGSPWLPNVGYGKLAPAVDEYFRKGLERLTRGDKSVPVLFYCKAECWMSWNAAKRAREEYGYANVLWYPAGVDGWAAAGHELTRSEPAP